MMLDIATDFSPYPSGRFPRDGTYNGQEFRKRYLVPALDAARNGDHLTVKIDNVRTFGSSFLEEAFGGLVREEGFSAAELSRLMSVACSKQHLLIYRDAIFEYISKAEYVRRG